MFDELSKKRYSGLVSSPFAICTKSVGSDKGLFAFLSEFFLLNWLRTHTAHGADLPISHFQIRCRSDFPASIISCSIKCYTKQDPITEAQSLYINAQEAAYWGCSLFLISKTSIRRFRRIGLSEERDTIWPTPFKELQRTANSYGIFPWKLDDSIKDFVKYESIMGQWFHLQNINIGPEDETGNVQRSS